MQSQETYWSPWSCSIGLRNEENLIRRGLMSTYKAGEIIFQQGDPFSGYLFYLHSGRVVIHTIGFSGEEKTHFILEKGSFFGEAAFFVQNIHIAASIAREDSQVVKISQQVLRELFAEDQDLPFYMLLVLARKIQQLASQVDDLAFLAINQRLARLLLKSAEEFGRQEDEGIMLPVSITDEDLGKLIGARRETVSRVMSSLKELGIVAKIKRKIYIKDLQALNDYLRQN